MRAKLFRTALLAAVCCAGLNGCVLAAVGAAGAGTFLAVNSDDFQGDGHPRPAAPPPPAYAPQSGAYQQPAYAPPSAPEEAPPAAAPRGAIQSQPLD